MAIRERHRALARLFWKRLGILALLGLAIFGALAVQGVAEKERESRSMRHEAEVQLADLQTQESTLSEHIDSLKTDRGKEAALREQYGVARTGEELIVIIEPQQSPIPIPEPSMREWVKKFLPFW